MFGLLTILLASFLGIAISLFLRHVRVGDHSHKHADCPPYYDCHLVLKSRFATLFGIPLEYYGLGYYGVIFAFYFAQFAFPILHHDLLTFGVLGLTSFAFLFSAYLTGLQLISLRKLCYWCLASALLCLVIFGATMTLTTSGIITLFAEYKLFLVILHLLGFALGLGGATVTDLFFFKFLRDFKISSWESKVLHEVSHLIWVGLAILIVSGVALWLPEMAALNAASKFIAKVLVVGIVTINGIFLNLYISPKMIHISFGEEHVEYPGQLHTLRRMAFASGAISIVSWYTAFILGTVPKSQPMTLLQIMTIYFAILIIAIIGSQVVERTLDRKAKRK